MIYKIVVDNILKTNNNYDSKLFIYHSELFFFSTIDFLFWSIIRAQCIVRALIIRFCSWFWTKNFRFN